MAKDNSWIILDPCSYTLYIISTSKVYSTVSVQHELTCGGLAASSLLQQQLCYFKMNYILLLIH